jgi:ubiquitin carboxyl-terminal hydrolase 34
VSDIPPLQSVLADTNRTCLKDVPDNLILHLKRFEFDLIDLSRRKIYDHFAFPETLDVSPYTIDHLADPSRACKEDLFDLVGVLVHTGTCENGHYYSYIRERPSPGGVVTPNWVEFNDSDVGPFNPEEIGERSFGGPADGDAYMRHFKPYSAYMLFYQRRTAIEDDQRRWITSVSNQSTKVAVPRPLEDAVNVNNAQFIREYCLFDPIHPRFLRQLYVSSRAVNHATCTEDHEQETKAIHLLLTHLAHTAWRQQSAGVFVDLLAPLRRSMLSCSACCEIGVRWLAADDHALTNLLIKCGQPQVRVHVRSLLLDSLRYLHGSEPASYGTEGSDDDMEIDTSTSPESVLSTLIGRLRTTANETTESVRGWDDYYLMMCQIAKLGHKETAMLLNHGFLEFCLKLFCMQQHEPFREEAPELARIMGKRTHIFNKLIAFSWKLLSQTSLRLPIIHDSHIREREATFDREAMRFPLTQLENEMLFHFSSELKAIVFFDKLLELYDDDPKKMEQYYPGDIIRYLLETRENTAYTRLLQTVREGILLDRPFCDNYIRVALPFCEACPIPGSIDAVISAVSTAIKKTGRVADDSAPAGRVVLGFLHGLLKAENPVLFEKTHAYVFHHYLMVRSHIYGIPLLCHYDESVRVAAHGLFEQLYGMEEAFNPDTMAVKYASIRELLPAMMHRFNFEQNINRYPSFLAPLNDACRVLIDQLYHLTQTEDPDERQFLDVNDPALVVQYQQEIEPRLRVWPAPMDGAPLSPGEPFDQSDYSNESDDGHDYLED